MSKAFFRFLRGEINGFYLNSVHNVFNKYTENIKAFFSFFNKQQFAEGKIDEEYLYGLGQFAGVLFPRLQKEDSITSLRMTDSFKVSGIEFSERGLFNIQEEQFQFYDTISDVPVSTDINTFATNTMRSSLVGNEQPIGYISSLETNVLDDNGNVRPEKILSEPPANVAYSEFYGNQFLFLSENKISYTNLDPSLYFNLFKTMQYIRYNGTSISSLVKIINLLCPKGLVKINSIDTLEGVQAFVLFYTFDVTAEVDLKQQRLYLLRYVIDTKFPQLILTEN